MSELPRCADCGLRLTTVTSTHCRWCAPKHRKKLGPRGPKRRSTWPNGNMTWVQRMRDLYGPAFEWPPGSTEPSTE